jgi:hypothetical protein
MSATDAPRSDADQDEQPEPGDPPISGDLPSPRRGAFPTPRSVLQEATPYVPGQAPDEEPSAPRADRPAESGADAADPGEGPGRDHRQP